MCNIHIQSGNQITESLDVIWHKVYDLQSSHAVHNKCAVNNANVRVNDHYCLIDWGRGIMS